MKYVKKAFFLLLPLLPMDAIAFAIQYSDSVAYPIVEPIDLHNEFIQRLDKQLLPAKYYRFLEENSIYSSADLKQSENAVVLKKLLTQYSVERLNSKLISSSASSIITD